MSDTRGIEALALRIRGMESRKGELDQVGSERRECCRVETSGWRDEADLCRLWAEDESESNLAIERIADPRHAFCGAEIVPESAIRS